MENSQQSRQEDQRQIIEKLRQGDEGAMKQVFRLYYPRLHYFSIQLIDNPVDAEDIVQEAFINFWLNIKTKEVSPENIQAYLYRMVRNRCLNYLERQQNHAERNGEMIEYFHHQRQRQMDELALKEEVYHRVSREFSHLTPIQTQVIKLLYMEGLPVAEVAEKLNTTANNVRNHKSRALERLKAVMKDEIFMFIIFFLIFFDLL